MVIPKPLDVDALIRRVPKGKLATMLQLREELARRSKVDVACPLCTGIFVRIVAEAAAEGRHAGLKICSQTAVACRRMAWWRPRHSLSGFLMQTSAYYGAVSAKRSSIPRQSARGNQQRVFLNTLKRPIPKQ